MLCPNCGGSNPDNSVYCANCGAVLRAQQAMMQPPHVPIPNYLVHAILVTILCCLPFGIVSIVYAAQVDSKAANGDYAGATESSENAKKWALVALVCGLAIYVVWCAAYAVIFAIGASRH